MLDLLPWCNGVRGGKRVKAFRLYFSNFGPAAEKSNLPSESW